MPGSGFWFRIERRIHAIKGDILNLPKRGKEGGKIWALKIIPVP